MINPLNSERYHIQVKIQTENDLQKLKNQYLKHQEKNPKAKINIVSCNPIPLRQDQHRGDGEYYCPYCMKWRNFEKHPRLSLKRCEICGITENDFFVKRYNKLWGEV